MEGRRRELGCRNLGKLREQNFAFYSLDIEQNVQTHYRSAGVLPYAVVKPETAASPAGADLLAWLLQSEDGTSAAPPIKRSQQPQTEVLFLMGGEVRHKKNYHNKPNFFWSDFGGKREAKDADVVETALREFDEETAGIFTEHMELFRERMRSDSTLKVWNGSGYSVLFLLEVPYVPDASATFCYFFNEHLAKLRSQVQAKLHNVLVEGQQVAVGGDLLGTLNKCAVRWLSRSHLVRAFDMLPVRSYSENTDTVTISTVQNLPSSTSLPSSSKAPSSSTPELFQMQLYPYFLEYLRCSDLQEAIKALPQPLAPDAYQGYTYPLRKLPVLQQAQRYHLTANHNYDCLVKDHPWLSSLEEQKQCWLERYPPPPPPSRPPQEEEEEKKENGKETETMSTTTTVEPSEEKTKEKKKKTKKKKRQDQEEVEDAEATKNNQEQNDDDQQQMSKKKKRKLNHTAEPKDGTQNASDDMETSVSMSRSGKMRTKKRSKWSIKTLKNEKKQARLWVDLELARLSALRDKKRSSLQDLEARLASLQAIRDQRLL